MEAMCSVYFSLFSSLSLNKNVKNNKNDKNWITFVSYLYFKNKNSNLMELRVLPLSSHLNIQRIAKSVYSHYFKVISKKKLYLFSLISVYFFYLPFVILHF